MNKVYYLSTCSTCKRILKDLGIGDEFEHQDIKTNPITEAQLDEMKEMAGNYAALFSKTAMKYRSMGLKEKNLDEKDYRQLILEEYTFLKRPVFITGDKIFIGNAKKTVEQIAEILS